MYLVFKKHKHKIDILQFFSLNYVKKETENNLRKVIVVKDTFFQIFFCRDVFKLIL